MKVTRLGDLLFLLLLPVLHNSQCSYFLVDKGVITLELKMSIVRNHCMFCRGLALLYPPAADFYILNSDLKSSSI